MVGHLPAVKTIEELPAVRFSESNAISQATTSMRQGSIVRSARPKALELQPSPGVSGLHDSRRGKSSALAAAIRVGALVDYVPATSAGEKKSVSWAVPEVSAKFPPSEWSEVWL